MVDIQPLQQTRPDITLVSMLPLRITASGVVRRLGSCGELFYAQLEDDRTCAYPILQDGRVLRSKARIAQGEVVEIIHPTHIILTYPLKWVEKRSPTPRLFYCSLNLSQYWTTTTSVIRLSSMN